jgi:hypothetical protein
MVYFFHTSKQTRTWIPTHATQATKRWIIFRPWSVWNAEVDSSPWRSGAEFQPATKRALSVDVDVIHTRKAALTQWVGPFGPHTTFSTFWARPI